MRAAIFREPERVESRSSATAPSAAPGCRPPSGSVPSASSPCHATRTALDIARARSMVGFVGVPHGVELPVERMFRQNVGVRGGGAPVRVYLPELLDDVLAEKINPGLVLDYETDLDGIGGGYAAMDERRAIKSLVRVGTV